MVPTEGGRADWSRLTEYLSTQAGGQVTLSWAEFGRIVGAVPASATRHYPQWWHGDRSHVRAWGAAGYTLGGVEPGRSVTFRRTDSPPTAGRSTTERQRTPTAMGPSSAGSIGRLPEIDPHRVMLIIQCSGAKQPGGQPAEASGIEPWPAALIQARRSVLAAARADESGLLPAWRRYSRGHFYAQAGLALPQAVEGGNVLILSGGYGLLHADEPIGNYNKIFKLRDWPRGLLEHLLVEHGHTSDALAVVAFASTSSDYARLLRRTPWRNAGMTAVLVTVTGVIGGAMGEVPRRLGQAFDCFWSRRPAEQYPAGITVEPLA